MRSTGAIQLARRVTHQAAFAKKLGVQQNTVSRWVTGENTPSAGYRATISELYQIDEGAWDQYPERQAVPNPPTPLSARHGKRRPIREIATDLETMAESLIGDMASDRMALPAEKAKVMLMLSQALLHLGKISGETSQMTEGAIIKTPPFRRVMKMVIDVITPWPDAMKALVDCLGEIEDEGE